MRGTTAGRARSVTAALLVAAVMSALGGGPATARNAVPGPLGHAMTAEFYCDIPRSGTLP